MDSLRNLEFSLKRREKKGIKVVEKIPTPKNQYRFNLNLSKGYFSIATKSFSQLM